MNASADRVPNSTKLASRERVEFTGAGGIRLAADAAGPVDGPPALLLHGGGQTRNAWGTTLESLGAAGWRAHTMDLRGHGESAWSPEGDYRIDAFTDDVVAVAASFDQPPVLVGASLGGLASLTAIGERPNATVAAGLVLVDVAAQVETEGRNRIGAFMQERMHDGFASLEEVADAVGAYNPHRARPTDLSGLRKNLRERDGRFYWHWDPAFVTGRWGTGVSGASNLTDPERLSAAAAGLTLPTLLVRGRMSDLLSEDGAKHFLGLVPHAEFADVAGAGHMVAGDRNDLFNDAVVSFLNRVRAAGK
jgi:pimeloyl-ACP methyl ester carboxylesterase